jgi:DNA ligase D-like protein (predicted 3'-phosphoesterase)
MMSPRSYDKGNHTAASKASDRLEEYRSKRDFRQTAEPKGSGARIKTAPHLRFVIQKHAASHLHYDLRLELDGVLKSWAVPKDPSMDPDDRRSAFQTEDHPLEYAISRASFPRARAGFPISMPVTWTQVEGGVRADAYTIGGRRGR